MSLTLDVELTPPGILPVAKFVDAVEGIELKLDLDVFVFVFVLLNGTGAFEGVVVVGRE